MKKIIKKNYGKKYRENYREKKGDVRHDLLYCGYAFWTCEYYKIL